MQALFVLTAVVGLLYFLFAKRRFDFFAVAFFSACAYFLPGFFGFVTEFTAQANGRLETSRMELAPAAYGVFVVVLIAILLAAIAFDLLSTEEHTVVKLRGGRNAAVWVVGLALVGFVLAALTAGDALLSPNKDDVVPNLNRWHVLWAAGATLGVAMSFKQRRWFIFAVCVFLLLADLFVGVRSWLAIGVVAVFTLWLSGKGVRRLALQEWRIALFGAAAAYFFFIYKRIYAPIKSGSWDVVAQRLGDTQVYADAVTKSEPFVTQSVLNEIVAQRFYAGPDHFWGLVNLLVPFSSGVLGRVTSFNSLFQPVLFPQQQRSGVASNIWGEMLSSGGWPLFCLFVLLFVLMLAVGSHALRVGDPVLVGGSAVFFASLAFYVHRHDLIGQIGLMRNFFLLWVGCTLFAMLWDTARRRAGERATPHGGSGAAPPDFQVGAGGERA